MTDQHPYPEPAPPRRRRPRVAVVPMIALLVVALAVLVGSIAAGRRSSASSPSAAPPAGSQQNAGVQHGYGGSTGGTPYGGDGGAPWGGGTARRPSTGTPGTLRAAGATSAQETGLVRIISVSKYDGAVAAGTGMVLTPNGTVVTNNHVVEGSTRIAATVMSTGQTYSARVLGTDVKDDVAVLQLQGAGGLPTVTPSVTGVQSGTAVTAVGDANGAGSHLSAAPGTVTGLRRSVTTQPTAGTRAERLRGMIQIDADVVPGDSGGALLAGNGQVVGMTTAASAGSPNVTGFAIPIATVLHVVGTVDSGAATASVHLGYNGFLGIELGRSGTTLAGVIAGTPASRLGLRAGDTVTAIDGKAVASASALRTAISTRQPGDTVTLTWTGPAGGTQSASVTLAQGPVA